MSAVWVEMYTPTSFVSPANISMYQLGYGIDAAIQSFTYFHNDIPIGTARPGLLILYYRRNKKKNKILNIDYYYYRRGVHVEKCECRGL